MNLVVFSIKTKGVRNFARRFWTVFTRFGFSEGRIRKAFFSILEALHPYQAEPTFFIPAVVLRRHTGLIAGLQARNVEIGVHGYVHNDYRALNEKEQYEQTNQAITVFEDSRIAHKGFRNPYLGWTEESLKVYSDLGFVYESNEAIHHKVIDIDQIPPALRGGYEKSLALFQAIDSNIYNLRPRFEGTLLRIPTSIPDDEMLFDRLRITNPEDVGRIWGEVMQIVYNYGGVYVLNLHPERGVLCKPALERLLASTAKLPLPVWITRLQDIAQWWQERKGFSFSITSLAPGRWQIEITATERATILARQVTVEDQPTRKWLQNENDMQVQAHHFVVQSTKCPCIGLPQESHPSVVEFLHEQGYPTQFASPERAEEFALYLDTKDLQAINKKGNRQQRIELVQKIEQAEVPLIRFGCWPAGHQAALSITGDIDSVTIQDFFLRIIEVYKSR